MQFEEQFGLMRLVEQSGMVIAIIAILLLLMSICTWYIVIVRAINLYRARKYSVTAEQLWLQQHDLAGIKHFVETQPNSPYVDLMREGIAAANVLKKNKIADTQHKESFLTRQLRRSIVVSTYRLESGLTILGSIGSTAPFIGLFGTVWGIYHALIGISAMGSATLDKVAGPVGEALIMTAFGLFVAIPSVLAYNFFIRKNRIYLALLNSFAYDVLAYLTMGSRIKSLPNEPLREDMLEGKPYAERKSELEAL